MGECLRGCPILLPSLLGAHLPCGTLRFWNPKHRDTLVRHILRLGIDYEYAFLRTGVNPGWSVELPHLSLIPYSRNPVIGFLWLQHRRGVFASALLASPKKHQRGGQSKQGPEQPARKSRTKEGLYFFISL